MSDEKRAEALARWLEQAGEPPEDLEPEVVEAIQVLRPDLAAPPRVDLDDILASVREGPLAAEPAGEGAHGAVVPFPTRDAEAPQGDEAPQAGARGPSWARRARRWGGVGALVAVAATALFALRPVVRDEVPTAGAAPWELMAEPAYGPAPQEVVSEETLADDAVVGKQAPPPAQASREAGNQVPADAPRDEVRPRTGAAKPAPAAGAPPPAGAGRVDRVDSLQTGASSAAAAAPPADLAEREVEVADMEAEVADMEADAAAYRKEAYEMAERERAAAQRAAPAAAETVSTTSERKGLFRRRAGAADEGADPVPAMADAPAAAPAPAPPPHEEGDLGALSRSAWPHDLGGWAQGLPPEVALPLVEAFAHAEDAAATGRGAEAVATLEPMIAEPARAGQEAARRLAVLHVRAGRLDEALAVVRRGLALSSANHPERSGLLWAQGEILARTGDVDGARAAYLEAIRLAGAR